MVSAEQFKQFHRPRNFKPYIMMLRDGRRFEVTGPFEVACSPDCRIIAAPHPRGGFVPFKLTDIQSIFHVDSVRHVG